LRLNDYLANLDLNKIGIAKKDINDLNSIDESVLKNDIDLAKRIIYSMQLHAYLAVVTTHYSVFSLLKFIDWRKQISYNKNID
jgi:hypothetical protein